MLLHSLGFWKRGHTRGYYLYTNYYNYDPSIVHLPIFYCPNNLTNLQGKCPPSIKSVPPPLLTSVAPRSIAAPPVIGSRHHPPMPHSASKMHLLPRSPINHDNAGAVYGPSAPMSPSFSPALSPLATSPSLSPIVTPRHPTSSHHVRPRKATDNELRI